VEASKKQAKIKVKSVFLLIMLATTVLAIILYYNTTKKTIESHLLDHRWCVENLVHDNEKISLKTIGLTISFNDCPEDISFKENNSLILPGINTQHVDASWEYLNDRIVIFDSENFKDLFNGEYQWKIQRKNVTLESARTRIELRKNDV
jgi:hypothetical protein